jgi:hypothetical protein
VTILSDVQVKKHIEDSLREFTDINVDTVPPVISNAEYSTTVATN